MATRSTTRWIGRVVAAGVALAMVMPSSTGTRVGASSGRPVGGIQARAAMFIEAGKATDQITAHDGKFWLGTSQVKLRGLNVIPTWDGSSPTDADFAQIASWGMNFVRFQLRWAFFEPDPPQQVGSNWIHTYDAQYTGYIKTMVEEASNHGLYVLLDNAGLPGPSEIDDWWPQWLYQAAYNSHHKNYTDMDDANTDYWTDALQQRFTSDFLKYVAGQFVAEPGVAGYEVLNEPARGNLPNTSQTTATMLGVSFAMAQAVRSVDPPRVVFFMTRGCCGEGVPNADFAPFVGLGNVALDVHDYYGGRWGAGLMMDPSAPDYGEVEQMVNRFTLSTTPYLGTTTVQEQIVKNFTSFLNPVGIPLLIGEFSGDPPDEPNTANLMGSMTSAFNEQGVSWTLFAYDGRFGIIDDNGQLEPWGQIVIDAAKAP